MASVSSPIKHSHTSLRTAAVVVLWTDTLELVLDVAPVLEISLEAVVLGFFTLGLLVCSPVERGGVGSVVV